MNTIFKETKIGQIGITTDNEVITKVEFSKKPNDSFGTVDSLMKEAFDQLNAYLNGDIKNFNLPLRFELKSSFCREVLNFVSKVPYGQTVSYKVVAEGIQNPKAYRAVGLALNKNPIPVFIPCHRVVGWNKKLTGYAGGVHIKRILLNLENGCQGGERT